MDSNGPSAFGDLLKDLRKCQRITQQELAKHLGGYRNTIGMWERGDGLSETKQSSFLLIM